MQKSIPAGILNCSVINKNCMRTQDWINKTVHIINVFSSPRVLHCSSVPLNFVLPLHCCSCSAFLSSAILFCLLPCHCFVVCQGQRRREIILWFCQMATTGGKKPKPTNQNKYISSYQWPIVRAIGWEGELELPTAWYSLHLLFHSLKSKALLIQNPRSAKTPYYAKWHLPSKIFMSSLSPCFSTDTPLPVMFS